MIREPLSLHHQSILTPLFKKLNLHLSEYTFSNLYLFRKVHHYEVITINQNIYISGQTRDKQPFFLLTSEPTLQLIDQLKFYFSDPVTLFPIPDQWLENIPPQMIQSKSFKDADSDYLFKTTKFSNYSGRHLNNKRNLVKQFHELYKSEHQFLTENLIEPVLTLIDQWQSEYANTLEQTDYEECKEAIFLFKKLNLRGDLWFIDQRLVGLIISEILSDDCCVLHFAKGLRGYKGIYQMMYQELALTLNHSVQWINLEQDLGIEGLRRAKLAYQPDIILKKWRLVI